MVNAHTHLYSGLAPLGVPAPYPPPASFVEILQRVWWRLDCALDADMLRAAARYYVADAVRHGTTALVDHHESPNCIEGSLDILADACEELRLPAVLCYGTTERNGGRLEGERGLAECQRFLRDNRRTFVRGVVGLHASFTVSDDIIRAAGELCREMGTVLHLHVAEDACDVEDARGRGYDGVIARLEALDALPPGSILAHGVHLAPPEVARLRQLGCWLVQNPRSNAQNRVGYASSLAGSDHVALGTDGFPSDMLAERTEGCRLAVENGEAAACIDARLLAGTRLVSRWFPELPDNAAARVRVESEWPAIEQEARCQAQRLAAAMQQV